MTEDECSLNGECPCAHHYGMSGSELDGAREQRDAALKRVEKLKEILTEACAYALTAIELAECMGGFEFGSLEKPKARVRELHALATTT